jgi:DNA-binding response OmpR family regulator
VHSDVSGRILIVEDNTDAREALRLMLEQNGHDIFEADSGPSGVASALANHPDVVLIDIGLRDSTDTKRPGGSGRYLRSSEWF